MLSLDSNGNGAIRVNASIIIMIHLWLETSVNVLFKNFAGHSRSIRAIRECNISDAHACKCNQLDRNILALPLRSGGLGLGNPSLEAMREYASSVKVTKPHVKQIVSQSHQLPEDSLTKLAQQEVRSKRLKELEHREERITEMAPRTTQRALDLATEKGSSAWLTVLPLQGLAFNLNKREFRDDVKIRYDWPVEDIPSTCACGEAFTVKQRI